MSPKIIKKDGKYSVEHNGKVIVPDFLVEDEITKEQTKTVNDCINELKKISFLKVNYHDEKKCLKVDVKVYSYMNLEGRTLSFDGVGHDSYDDNNISIDNKTWNSLPVIVKEMLKNAASPEEHLSSNYICEIPEVKKFKKTAKSVVEKVAKQIKSFTDEMFELFIEKYESLSD